MSSSSNCTLSKLIQDHSECYEFDHDKVRKGYKDYLEDKIYEVISKEWEKKYPIQRLYQEYKVDPKYFDMMLNKTIKDLFEMKIEDLFQEVFEIPDLKSSKEEIVGLHESLLEGIIHSPKLNDLILKMVKNNSFFVPILENHKKVEIVSLTSNPTSILQYNLQRYLENVKTSVDLHNLSRENNWDSAEQNFVPFKPKLMELYQMSLFGMAVIIAKSVQQKELLNMDDDIVFPSPTHCPRSEKELIEFLTEDIYKCLKPLIFHNVDNPHSNNRVTDWINNIIQDGVIQGGFIDDQLQDFIYDMDITYRRKHPKEFDDGAIEKNPEKYIERRLRFEFKEETNEVLEKVGLKLENLVDHFSDEVRSKGDKEEVGAAENIGRNRAEDIPDKVCEDVASTLKELRSMANEKAVEELFEMMEIDSSIKESVREAFKKSWKEGEGGLIGADVKANQSFLTQERRNIILKRAAELSEFSDKLHDELEKFEQELKKDIETGKIIVSQKPMAIRYKGFFALQKKAEKGSLTTEELSKWKTEYQKIVNEAWLRTEMQKVLNPKKATGSLIENQMLQKMGHGNPDDLALRKLRNDAQKEVLNVLLQGEGMEFSSIEEMQKHVEDERFTARLKASKVEEKLIEQLKEIIILIQHSYHQLDKESDKSKKSIHNLPMDFPTKAKKQLLKMKEASVEGMVKRALNGLIDIAAKHYKENTLEDAISDLKKIAEEKIEKAKLGNVFKQLDKTLENYINFYNEWGPYIVKELIQGLDDEDEIFKEGVCTGISIRWAMAALNQVSFNKAIPGKLEHVRRKDRLRQAAHSVSIGIRAIASKTGLVKHEDIYKTTYPEALRKASKIKDMKGIFYTANPDDPGAAFEKAMRANEKNLSKNGVALITFGWVKGGGHATYVRYDIEEVDPETGEKVNEEDNSMPEINGASKIGRLLARIKAPIKKPTTKKVFVGQIGDPNLGIIQMPIRDVDGKFIPVEEAKKMFFKCFSDLLKSKYGGLGDFDRIEGVKIYQ